MYVLLLPPSDSLRIHVNTESLNGIWSVNDISVLVLVREDNKDVDEDVEDNKDADEDADEEEDADAEEEADEEAKEELVFLLSNIFVDDANEVDSNEVEDNNKGFDFLSVWDKGNDVLPINLLDWPASLLITSPNVLNDLLIFIASLKLI